MSKKYLLAIETSGKVCGVALCQFENVATIVAEYSINIGNKHDKYAADFVRRILQDNDVDITDILAVAVSVGPGSFTGLRIGVAIAKGLCFNADGGNEIKLIAVPTLEAMALKATHLVSADKGCEIVSAIPSHSDLLYYQCFDLYGNANGDVEFVSLSEMVSRLSAKQVFLVTNYPIEYKFLDNISYGLREQKYISASDIAFLGVEMYLREEFSSPLDLVPVYIQDFIPNKK